MQAILHLKTTGNLDFSYEKPFLVYMQQHFPQVIQYDIDNHSDAMLVGYAIKLLEDASQIVLLVEASEGKTQVLLPFFETLLIHQHKCLVIYNGTNTVADKYFNLLEKERKRKNIPDEEAQNIVQTFFQ